LSVAQIIGDNKMIIGNGKVITNDSNNTFIENGAVLIKDNVIDEIGNFDDLKKIYPNMIVIKKK